MRSNDAAAGFRRWRRLRVSIALLVLGVGATCAAGAIAGQQAATAGPTYKKVGSWGKAGSGNGQFNNAFGLATDKTGNVYVADSDNRRVQVFTSRGTFVRKLFPAKTSVLDVAIDPEGNIWATNDTDSQARQFSKDGAPLASIDTPKSALGIAVDAAGSVFVATAGDNIAQVIRYDKTATGWEAGKTWGGFQAPRDVEVSSDGSVYVSDDRLLNVRRYDRDGKLLKAIKGGNSAPLGVGVDLDCNVWMTNIAQRRIEMHSPSGRLLATATSGDLLAQDIAVGPTGDLYVYDLSTHSVIHFAEDRSKPPAALVAGIAVTKKAADYVARVRYTLSGVACPAQIDATASLAGKGIAGSAHVKVGAGKATVIEIPLAKGALAKVAGTTATATFRIVLKTNGRPTTQTRAVTVSVPRA